MIKVPHRDVLARKRVRYVGQEVALVVATSPAAAQDAAEAIEVEYRDLPAVVDAARRSSRARRSCTTRSRATSRFDYEYGDETGGRGGVRAARRTSRA